MTMRAIVWVSVVLLVSSVLFLLANKRVGSNELNRAIPSEGSNATQSTETKIQIPEVKGTANGSSCFDQLARVSNHEAWLIAFKSCAKDEPESAALYATQSAPQRLRSQALVIAIESWCSSAPDKAAKSVETVDASDLRTTGLATVARMWLVQEPASGLSWIKTLPGIDRSLIAENFLRSGVPDLNPITLVELSQSVPFGPSHSRLFEIAFNKYYRSDPQNASEWLAGLKGPDLVKGASIAISSLARADPDSALQLLGRLGVLTNLSIQKDLVTAWAENDPQAAIKWSASITNEWERSRVIGNAIRNWASRSPVEAANYVAGIPPGETQNEAAFIVLSAWSKEDTQSASQWVDKFPEGQLKDKATVALADKWAIIGGSGASNWLVSLPESGMKDHALSEYTGAMYDKNPEAAAQWALQIENEDERNRRIAQAFYRWCELDAQAASLWVSANNIPTNMRSRMLEIAEKSMSK